MEQERNIRQAEVAHAQQEVERMRIQLEQVVAEQSIYAAGLLPVSVACQPLDQLLPVRLGNAWLRAAEAELAAASAAIGLLPQFESTLVHTNRFFELYNLKLDIQDRPDLPVPHNVQGEIRFHDTTARLGVCYRSILRFQPMQPSP